jgi:hypothetical protein
VRRFRSNKGARVLFEVKLRDILCCGLMEDNVFARESFGKVQNSGSRRLNVSCRLNPNEDAQNVSS